MKVLNRRGEEVELADGKILPDGFTLRCPSFLMDGGDDVQREIAARTTRARITDSAGRPAGSRPGFCYDANDNEQHVRIAYDAMVARSQNNWRTTAPAAPVAISRGTPAQIRDAAYDAMVKRQENSWRSPSAAAKAIIDADKVLDDPEAERERAYEERKRKMSEAWKTTKGVGFGPGSFGA